MAHRLTDDQGSDSSVHTLNDQGIAGNVSLKRRDCVRFGAAALGIASGLGGGLVASSTADKEYLTDFAEYAQ